MAFLQNFLEKWWSGRGMFINYRPDGISATVCDTVSLKKFVSVEFWRLRRHGRHFFKTFLRQSVPILTSHNFLHKTKKNCSPCRHRRHVQPEQWKPRNSAVIFRYFAELLMPPFSPFILLRILTLHCKHMHFNNAKNEFFAQKYVHIYNILFCCWLLLTFKWECAIL